MHLVCAISALPNLFHVTTAIYALISFFLSPIRIEIRSEYFVHIYIVSKYIGTTIEMGKCGTFHEVIDGEYAYESRRGLSMKSANNQIDFHSDTQQSIEVPVVSQCSHKIRS